MVMDRQPRQMVEQIAMTMMQPFTLVQMNSVTASTMIVMEVLMKMLVRLGTWTMMVMVLEWLLVVFQDVKHLLRAM